MSYRDFKLSNFGWITAAFLVTLGYLVYYIWFYPDLSAISFHQAFTSKQDKVPDIEINLTSPIYLASYQPSLLSVSIRNISTSKAISGNVVITPILFDDALTALALGGDDNLDHGLMFDGVQKKTHTISFSKLEAGRSQDFLVKMQLPSDKVYYTIVTIDLFIDDPSFLNISKDHIAWEGKGHTWVESSLFCGKDKNNYTDPNVQICMENNAYGVFAESALQKLLLPPFANFLLPFLAFGFVWLIEQILPSEWLSGDMHRVWTWVYVSLLFLLPTILILTSAWFVLNIMKKVSDGSKMYFWFLASMLFIIIAIRYVFFRIRKAEWGIAKDVDKNKEINKIEDAYKKKDLIKLKKIISLSTNDAPQLFNAKRRHEQLKNRMQNEVDAWGEDIKAKEFEEALRKVTVFFRNLPGLASLPDLEQVLSPLLEDEKTVSFSVESEWEFGKPENAPEIIIQALQDEIDDEASRKARVDSAANNVSDSLEISLPVEDLIKEPVAKLVKELVLEQVRKLVKELVPEPATKLVIKKTTPESSTKLVTKKTTSESSTKKSNKSKK